MSTSDWHGTRIHQPPRTRPASNHAVPRYKENDPRSFPVAVKCVTSHGFIGLFASNIPALHGCSPTGLPTPSPPAHYLLSLDRLAEDDRYILTAADVCVVRSTGSLLAVLGLWSRKSRAVIERATRGKGHLTV
jgi:hypothetical protein